MSAEVNLLKSKILRAEVTECCIDYEGSLAIDTAFMRAVDLFDYERILVGNLTTGARFETYAMPAPKGSKTIGLNGAAARLGAVGDLIVIMAFIRVDMEAARHWRPKKMVLSNGNQTLLKAPSDG